MENFQMRCAVGETIPDDFLRVIKGAFGAKISAELHPFFSHEGELEWVEVETKAFPGDVEVGFHVFPKGWKERDSFGKVVTLSEEEALWARGFLPGGVTASWGWRSDGMSGGQSTGHRVNPGKKYPLSQEGVRAAIADTFSLLKREVEKKLGEAEKRLLELI